MSISITGPYRVALLLGTAIHLLNQFNSWLFAVHHGYFDYWLGHLDS